MVPIIEEFVVSPRARRHMVTKHGIDFLEAVDAAESTQRMYRTSSNVASERRYVVPGKTAVGRRLWVIFNDEGSRRGRIVTAFEPVDRRDIAKHRRMRGD